MNLIEKSKNLSFKNQIELRKEEDKIINTKGFHLNNLQITNLDHRKCNIMKYIILTSLPFTIDNIKIDDWDLWNCSNCTLCKDNVIYRRTMPTGNINAKYMVIGDAPGMGDGPKSTLDRIFTYGPSSKALRLALYEVKIIHEVWFTNLLKCAKLNNRESDITDVICCRDNLIKEIECIEPELIILLGAHVENMFNNLYPKVRNKIKTAKIYHPSYIVRMGKNKKEYADHIRRELKL
jgi:uracil-DNA glycosylase family 4